MFCKSNVNKAVYFFLLSLNYREIMTVKTTTLYKKLYFFIKNLKSKKRKLALTSFYYVGWEIWLSNSKKLICIDQSRFYHTGENSKIFNITSKYFTFFNNKLDASSVTHITDFLTSYSCLYYSSMIS